MASLSAGMLCTSINLPYKKSKFPHSLQVRAQSYEDEGRSSNNNIVDANLHVLRVRIGEVGNKERLERCCGRVDQSTGWDYASVAAVSYKAKGDHKELPHFEFLRLVGIAVGSLGLTILSCTFAVCFFSLLVHFIQ